MVAVRPRGWFALAAACLLITAQARGQDGGVRAVTPGGDAATTASPLDAAAAAPPDDSVPEDAGPTDASAPTDAAVQNDAPSAPSAPTPSPTAAPNPAPSPARAATAAASPSREQSAGAARDDGEIVVRASEPMSAASSQIVRDRDLQLRPRTRPGDLFEVAPGMMVVQHAGGGKANQYFLRGFDADHGTDIALSVDNVPFNMVSHGHGQGYADPHFIVPELVERIEVREGPYFAQDGNFATAGAINLRLRETVERSSVTYEQTIVANPMIGWNMLNNERFLGIVQTNLGPIRGYVAAELVHTDGPFLHPLNYNRYNAVGRWGVRLGSNIDLALTVMSYGGAWNASGQIPARLVDQTYTPEYPDPLGAAPRTFTPFDAIDPSEGGQSGRHQAYATLRARPDANSELNALAYVQAYQLSIFSNFTLFLDDPVNGDGIEQTDDRVMAGYRVTYRRLARLGAWRFVTTVGSTLRFDSIDNSLHRNYQRQRFETVGASHINEVSAGVFAEEQIIPARWLRLVLGLRADYFDFTVTDRRTGVVTPDPGRNGARQQMLLSPKATLVVSPVHTNVVSWDLYGNFGRGFHSNDGRGAVIQTSPLLMMQCADPMRVPFGVRCPVTPLTAATGYEVGTRLSLLRRFDFSVAAWMLDLDAETVWNGDSGGTEVGGPTRRLGLTFEARAQILSWLWADADVSIVNAVYTQNAGNANAVALAPPFVLSAGVSARHPIGLSGAVRVRAITDRPADPMNMFQAHGFAIFSLAAAYRRSFWEIGLNIENLFNSTWREAQFEEDSRLRSEAAPVTDIKYTPGTPFAATLRLSLFWR